MDKKIFVSGAAGFIGFHLCRGLAEKGYRVIGLDNINDYYDPALKNARLDILRKYENFAFIKGDITERELVDELISSGSPDVVVNLAAQAGVRYSIENPGAYISSNIVGFFNVLEACKGAKTPHLIYASSSSVYGEREETPFSVSDDVSRPVSLYAATKKSNELMAYSYSHLFGLPTTGIRFFTVYGPYGRPDMAYFSFAEKIAKGKPIKVFNNGEMLRDFTYIDDAVNGLLSIIQSPPPTGDVPAEVYNIGNNKPVKLAEFIEILSKALGKEAKQEFLPLQPGDVLQTFADIKETREKFGFNPLTSIEEGLENFARWFWEYKKS